MSKLTKLVKILTITTAFCVVNNSASACTRALYANPKNIVLVGRSMDWEKTAGSNIWLFPKGMDRNGAAGPESIKWKSKYGSVVATFFDAASVDGMNEKGLVINVLYLVESIYPTPKKNDPRKPISIAAWGQYVLDNFATVNEAVDALQKEPFYVIPITTPDGHPGNGHLAISDPTGDSAIFEYIDGVLVIHHDKKYNIMTNSPTFDKQLAIDSYWEEISGEIFLPGTSRAADRFVRASYYTNNLPQNADLKLALSGIFSVMRNVSAPFGVNVPGKPNIATTLWRSVSDQGNLVYYYESTSSPDVFWINFKDLDFTKDTMMIGVNEGQIYAGNAADKFVKKAPFKFLEAKVPAAK